MPFAVPERDQNEILQRIAESVKRLTDANVVAIVLPAQDPTMLEVAVATGDGEQALRGQRLPAVGSLPGSAMAKGHGVLVDSAPEHVSLGIRPEQFVEHVARNQPRRKIIVAHADRTARDHALRETVLHLGRQIDDFTAFTWYERVEEDDDRSRPGYMDLSEIELPDDVQVFTCGPLPFMRHVRTSLQARGVPAARIRYEVFGPDLWAAQTEPHS